MTEQLSIVTEAKNRVVSTPGELKGLREAAGLSIPGTAGQLRLAARQVEALELGEWDKLPGIAFIKGALRSYGRLLSADLSPLIAFVDQQLGRNELKADRTLEGKISERSALGFGEGGKGNKWAWVGLALIGLAAAALFFGQGLESYIPKQFIPPSKVMELPKEMSPSASSVGSSIPTSSQVGVGSVASANAQRPLASSSQGEAPKVETPMPTSSGIPPLATVNPSGRTAPVGSSSMQANEPNKSADLKATGSGSVGAMPAQNTETQYQVNFAKDSWVEIKDASGERVLYGTQAGGTFQVLKGKAPYAAVIGNAIHVKIAKKEPVNGALGGEQVVVMPKEMPQGIARLTIR